MITTQVNIKDSIQIFLLITFSYLIFIKKKTQIIKFSVGISITKKVVI